MVHKKKEQASTSSPSSEVQLRHLTVDEALLKLDKYLNDAFMAGLWQVRVVHGKGTGTLHQAAHRALAQHPLVKSYPLGLSSSNFSTMPLTFKTVTLLDKKRGNWLCKRGEASL